MSATRVSVLCALVLVSASFARAHLIDGGPHEHTATGYDFRVRPRRAVTPLSALRSDTVLLTQVQSPDRTQRAAGVPVAAKPFQAFAPEVKVHWDERFLYVESAGTPAHRMMVGITAWQQQVPLPQPYTGNNAWRIPLHPVPARSPVSIKDRFLRGAVAVAVNGVPIFNPQNNRGEISQEIGELDQWGGHCGRADDYHYHATPFHLQEVAGKGQPLAFALDGYPIYGLTEPDGSTPVKLDAFNGHETPGLGYHYHGSTKYPYVNGGFRGEIVERDGQADPQPRAQPWREAGAPLRGARITGFTSNGPSYSLQYQVDGETRQINYTLNTDGTVKFDHVDGKGRVRSETHSRQQRGPGGDRPPGEPKGKDGKKGKPKQQARNGCKDPDLTQPVLPSHS
jgi:hypothetical protein